MADFGNFLINMKLGDISEDDVWKIHRVPGGWIYYNDKHSVFVPFSNEFQTAEPKVEAESPRTWKEDYIDALLNELDAVVKEFGMDSIKKAVMIGPQTEIKFVGFMAYIHSSTLHHEILCNVEYKIARFFEDLA